MSEQLIYNRQSLVDSNLHLQGYLLDFSITGASADAVFEVLSDIELENSGDLSTFIKLRSSQLDADLLDTLDCDSVVLLLEGSVPEAMVIECVEKHFRIGLCRPNSTSSPLLKYAEFSVLAPNVYTGDRLKQLTGKLRAKSLLIIAEKVEQQSQIVELAQNGFDYFVGSFMPADEM